MSRPRPGRPGTDRRDERGSIIVLWAVALTAIMGLVALSVDLGNLAQTKQHTRNAAQDAVLAGVVDLAALGPGGGGTVSNQEALAVKDAETYLLANYNIPTPDWNSCGAFPTGMPSIQSYSTADCFGFFTTGGSSAPNGMAVQVPPRLVATTFGRADGISGRQVSSTAYASIQTAGSSYVLPFSYAAGGGSGLQCLKTGSGTGAANCPGFTTGSGKFGTINSPRYVIFPGSQTQSGNNATVQTDLVLGLDHPLDQYTTGAGEICDANGSPPNCPAYNNTAPYTGANYVAPSTGLDSSALDGLFEAVTSPDGSCTFTPRLNHPFGFVASANCPDDNPSNGPGSSVPLLITDFGGAPLGTPPSTDLNGQSIAAFTSACSQEVPKQYGIATPIDAQTNGTYVWGPYDTCLSTALAVYDPSVGGPVLGASIVGSPRFGIVPLVGSSNGGGAEQITGFAAVYLDLMFGKGSKVDSVLAWVLPLGDIKSAPAPAGGAGLGGYYGGPYVANLCSYTSAGTNC